MADFEIEALLQKAMGLKVTSIGKTTLERSVQRRMDALSVDAKADYVEILKNSALELKELIEEVVIPETWFFRDSEPFKAMIQYLQSQWAPRHENTIFKVLSVPCSTGEEPYSLTMALLTSGWPAEKFTVHAVDISSRSIARAKEGLYSKHSFRGSDLAYQSEYFRKSPPYFILNKDVRDKVHFHTGNVLNNTFMEELGRFDVIFFRNVLIYFDTLSRHQAIATLCKTLADDGILFVGHAEANILSASSFAPAPYRKAFAFHKRPRVQLRVETNESTGPKPASDKTTTASTRRLLPLQKKEHKHLPDLGRARQMADKGELEKATALCEEYLDQCGPSVQAFFLLGIIRDAANDPVQAEKLFRKALYLDPHHEESLVFLALLAEKKGDIAEAKNLKQRISRLQGITNPQPQKG
jgi:chemotaxis protein methyltransferase WspC